MLGRRRLVVPIDAPSDAEECAPTPPLSPLSPTSSLFRVYRQPQAAEGENDPSPPPSPTPLLGKAGGCDEFLQDQKSSIYYSDKSVEQEKRGSSFLRSIITFRNSLRAHGTRMRLMFDTFMQREFILSCIWLLCAFYYLISVPFEICFLPDYTFDNYKWLAVLDFIASAYLLLHFIAARAGKKEFEWEALLSEKDRIDDEDRATPIAKCVHVLKMQLTKIRKKRREESMAGVKHNKDELKNKPQKNGRSFDIMAGLLFCFKLGGKVLDTTIKGFSVFPLVIIGHFIGVEPPWLSVWNVNRFFLFFSLFSKMGVIFGFLERRGRLTNVMLQRVVILFTLTIVTSHNAASFFFYISKMEATEGGRAQETWIYKDGLIDESGSLITTTCEAYGRSYYWAVVTMITVGYGDIVPHTPKEVFFTVLTMYVGLFLLAANVANLTLLMTTADRARNQFQLRMDATNKYMNYRNLPDSLKARITSFFNYRWKLLKGMDEQAFLESLPQTLRNQVTISMTHGLLMGLKKLQSPPRSLLNALASNLEQFTYSPGDEVIAVGEAITSVLLVSSGKVNVFDDRGALEYTLQAGENYGVECLQEANVHLTPLQSSNFLQAKTFCEVYTLPADAFFSVTQMFSTSVLRRDSGDTKAVAERQKRNRGKALKLFGSENAIDDPFANNFRGFSRYCVPESSLRCVWDTTIFTTLLFYSIALPLHISACLREATFLDQAPLLVPGYIADGVFLVDLVLQSRLFFYREASILIFEPKKIWAKYWSTHSFFLEIASALPVDLLGIYFGSSVLSFLRLTKIPRLVHLIEYTRKMHRYFLENKKSAGVSSRRFLYLNFGMVLACHWVGCLWLFSSNLSKKLNLEDDWTDIDEDNPAFQFSYNRTGMHAQAYLRAVYFAMVSMSTVGYGDIVPQNNLETAFAILIVLIGGMLLPAVIGGLAALISGMQQVSNAYKTKMNDLSAMMEKKEYPKHLHGRILHYYDYMWSRQGGMQEEHILDELPAPLRRKVAMAINGHTLKNIPFFNCEDTSAAHGFIVAVLQPCTFLPGDLIIRSYEVGKEMYMIEKGVAEVQSAGKGLVLTKLYHGDYFGESSLLLSVTQTSHVKAVTYCDTFVLAKSDFMAVTEVHPWWREKILKALASSLKVKTKMQRDIVKNMRHYPKLRSHVGITDMHRRATTSHNFIGIIDPGSNFLLFWEITIFVTILMNIVWVPLGLAFLLPVKDYIVLWCLDILLVADIYLKVRCFAFVKEGQLVVDRSEIWKNYSSKWLRRDLTSAFPYELLALPLLLLPPVFMRLGLAIARIPKLLRAPELLSLHSSVGSASRKLRIPTIPVQLVQLLGGVIIVAHWAACGMYMFANLKNCGLGTCGWEDTWVNLQIDNDYLPEDGGSLFSRYIRSLNWGMPTLVVVVIGDVIPTGVAETVYALLCMLLGVTINATIIGNLANVVANLESHQADYLGAVDAIKLHMHRLATVPTELTKRIDDFLSEMWTRHNGYRGLEKGDSYYANIELPRTLNSEVCEHFVMKLLDTFPVFQGFPRENIKNLGLQMVREVYAEGDIIVQAGEQGNEMYWVDVGTVHIVSKDHSVTYAVLTHGSFFGETACFFSTERTATVKAAKFCELLRLDTVAMQEELGIVPGKLGMSTEASMTTEKFSSLRACNERRNVNVSRNITDSLDPKSKLHKMIQVESQNIPVAETKGGCFDSLLLPKSHARAAWESFAVFALYYLAGEVPFRASFIEEEYVLFGIEFDWFLDVFLIIDLFLRYFERILPPGSAGISTKKVPRIHKIDIVASIPFDFLALVPSIGTFYLPFLRLPKVLRLFCLGRHVAALDAFMMTKYRIRLNMTTRLLVKLFGFYMIISNIWACAWFGLHRYIEIHEPHTWAIHDGLATFDYDTGKHTICPPDESFICYGRAYYFALTTLSTTGYGDITPRNNLETFFQWVVLLTGACIFAGAIGAFTAFFQHLDKAGNSAFKVHMLTISNYMKGRELPGELQDAVYVYFQQLWSKNRVLDMKELLSPLSPALQLELNYTRLNHVFQLCPSFSRCSELIRKRLGLAFTEQVCLAGASLYSEGDFGDTIFFVLSGSVSISFVSNMKSLGGGESPVAMGLSWAKHATMGKAHQCGNHFGEWCLLLPSNVRVDNARVKSTAELYSIERNQFATILEYLSENEQAALVHSLLTTNGTARHTKVCKLQKAETRGCWLAEAVCPDYTNSKITKKKIYTYATPRGSKTCAVQRFVAVYQGLDVGRRSSRTRRATLHERRRREQIMEEIRRLSLVGGERW